MGSRLIFILAALAPQAAAATNVVPDFDVGGEAVPSPVAPQGFSGLELPPSRDSIWVIWQLRQRLIREGRADLADKKLEELLAARLDLGLRNVSLLALGLLDEAWEAALAGDAPHAALLARTAEALAPDLPEPNLALARLAVMGDVQPGAALGEALKGARKTLLHPLRLHRLAGELALRLLAAILLVIAAFTISAWVRYGRLLQHDLRELLPRGASGRQALVLLGMLALSPPLLGLPPGATVALWLVALFGYQDAGERLLGLLSVCVLATLPWTLRVADRFLVEPGGVAETLYEASYDMADEGALERLTSAADGERPDPDMVFTLGLVNKRAGRLEQAAARLRQAFELSGQKLAEAQILLGNVYLAGNRLEEADTAYSRALALAPESAVANFNRAKLFQARGDADGEASAAMATALALDEHRIERFQQSQATALNRYVLDEPVPRRRLLARLFAPAKGVEALGPSLWPWIGGAVRPKDAPALGGILVLLMAVLWALRGRLVLASACVRCGDAVCVRCAPGISRTGNCARCYDVFHRAERVEPMNRQRRELAVRGYQRRRRTLSLVLTFLLTGTGHFLVGRVARGVAFSLAFFLFLGGVLAWEGILRPTTPSFPGFPVGQVAAQAVVFGVVYLLAILDIRVEERR